MGLFSRKKKPTKDEEVDLKLAREELQKYKEKNKENDNEEKITLKRKPKEKNIEKNESQNFGKSTDEVAAAYKPESPLKKFQYALILERWQKYQQSLELFLELEDILEQTKIDGIDLWEVKIKIPALHSKLGNDQMALTRIFTYCHSYNTYTIEEKMKIKKLIQTEKEFKKFHKNTDFQNSIHTLKHIIPESEFYEEERVEEINPIVIETFSYDVGHGIGRLDEKSMKALDLKEGEFLEVQAKRSSVVKCQKQEIGNSDKISIQIDGITRNNIGAEFDDVITVKKIVVSPAKEITLKPLEHDDEQMEMISTLTNHDLLENLSGVPVTYGDNIAIKHDENWLAFQVIETHPLNLPVEITKDTVLHLVDFVNIPNQSISEQEPSQNHEKSEKETTFKQVSMEGWTYACLQEAQAIILKHHVDYDTAEFFAHTTYELFSQTDRENAYGYIELEPNSNHFNIGIHEILLEQNPQNERMLVIVLVHELLHAIHDREGWGHDKINPLERKLANLAGYFDALIEMDNLAISGRMHFCDE